MIVQFCIYSTTIEQRPLRSVSRRTIEQFVCNFNSSRQDVRYPFIPSQKSRYVFTRFDIFTLSVFLFFCVTLNEVCEDKKGKIEHLLWSLGVSNSERMISWYICQLIQAMIWSAVNLLHVLPQTMSMSTNIVFLWFLYVLVFFSTSIFALLCSKFVTGTASRVLAIIQMIVISIFLFLWSHLQQSSINLKPLRYLILLHPVSQSRNIFMLTQVAEFSRIGFSLSSLTTLFNSEGEKNDFFGNGLETFLLLFFVSISGSILFAVNLKSVWGQTVNSVRKHNKVDNGSESPDSYQDIEMTSETPRPVVQVESLSMTYPDELQALSNVSFSIYPGEIVSLLGKNEAGKSTAVNVIAGIYKATKGSVKVAGFDLSYEKSKALDKLSFCPQDNLFFYRLTVLEHLKLICYLKNVNYERYRAEQLLTELNLWDEKDSRTRDISEAQKRRVSIAMAFIANSPLVILDEPTSAVDSATQKILWSFFQSRQKNNPEQAVILCTNSMQEADWLSQRIAIFVKGKLRAIGSSSQLKSLFGVGFHSFTYDKSNADAVRSIIPKIYPNANFHLSEENASFRVPVDQSGHLPDISDNLESSGIEYSFRAETLENAFESLSANFDQNELETAINTQRDQIDQAGGSHDDANGPNSPESWFVQQCQFSFYAVFVRIFVENWKFFFIYTIIFFTLPQLLMIYCNFIDDDGDTFDEGNMFENGNISVTPSTLFADPKVAIFGDAPNALRTQVAELLWSNSIRPVTDQSLSEIISDYENKPSNVINKYPFFLNYSSRSEKFECLVNNHLDSSLLFCMSLLFNLYHNSSFSPVMPFTVGVTYYPSWSLSSRAEGDSDGDGDLDDDQKQCKAYIFHHITTLIYFCLLFAVVRFESGHTRRGLLSFYRANGAHPLFSFTFRVLAYSIIAFVYFVAIVIMTEELSFYFPINDKILTIPNYSMTGPILLFSFTFACFVVLVTKRFRSIPCQLFLTVILGAFYWFLFRTGFHWVIFLYVPVFFWVALPGYMIPVGPIGLLLNFGLNQEIVPSVIWFIQLIVFLSLDLLFETLRMRRHFLSSSLCNRNGAVATTEPPDQSELAICARDVSHTYGHVTACLCCCCCCCGEKEDEEDENEALKRTNLNIKPGECYAIVGVNRAGKSTILDILTGSERLQKGDIFVFGKSVRADPLGVLNDIGYCPQLDKVPTYLKAKSVVALFGKLRGLTNEEIEEQINYMCGIFNVGRHMHKFIGGCGGVIRRNVSTMVAFIGFPKLIVLDECTTGKTESLYCVSSPSNDGIENLHHFGFT